jgi:hypothetical protein
MLLLLLEQRTDLLGRVNTCRSHRFHHQPSLPQYLFLRVVLEETMRDSGCDGQARPKDNGQHYIEFS